MNGKEQGTSLNPTGTPRIPLATYRLQLRPDFTLSDAAKIADYLAALGISDLYLSPIFAARSGSEHGYDVVDYGRVNPTLGGEPAFEALAGLLKERGMGLLLDMVSNHMGIGDEANRLWWDVLENGPSSPYAAFFDIDWNPPKTDLANQVLLPALGDQYGIVLEAGHLKTEYRDGAFVVRYFDRVFPIAPITAVAVLGPLLEELKKELPAEHETLIVPDVGGRVLPLHHTRSLSETDYEISFAPCAGNRPLILISAFSSALQPQQFPANACLTYQCIRT